MAENFEQALGTLCETIVNIEKPYYQSDLQPFQAYAATLTEQIKETVTAYKNSLARGYHLVLENIAKISPLEVGKYDISSKIENFISDKEDLEEILEKKKVLQVVFGYTGKMMREIYIFADSLLQAKNYKDAEDVFFFLISLNPYICWFWQGLGKCMQMQERMDEAIHSYLVSINCDPLRIHGYNDVVRCSLAFKNFDLAYQVIDYGRGIANAEQSKELNNGLETMMAYIEKIKTGG